MAPAADSRPSRIVRIGQIVPSSNTTMETEIPAMLRAREQHFAERFTFHSSRMRMKRVSAEELAAMNQEGLRCAAELADARVDVMSTACLVAIMAQEDFKRVVAENGARSKVMTSAGALIHGLKKLGAKKISLLAPYIKPLTAKVVSYIEHEGIEVLDRISFEIPDNLEVARRDPMRLLDEVKRLKIANADAVVLSACVQMPSLAAVQLVEDELGLPVISAATATAYETLRALGHSPAVAVAGSLLAGNGRDTE